MELMPSQWKLAKINNSLSHYFNIYINRMPQETGEDKYSIKWNSYVLNKNNELEFEPFPSSRDDDYLERCRFNTFDEAKAALEKAIKAGLFSVNGYQLNMDGGITPKKKLIKFFNECHKKQQQEIEDEQRSEVEE